MPIEAPIGAGGAFVEHYQLDVTDVPQTLPVWSQVNS